MKSGTTNKTRTTLKDVAELADVTAQTVSRVLRNKGYFTEETRIRVLEAVHELNYIPSYAAKALRSGMPRSIAVVFDDLKNFYFSIMIGYLRTSILSHGFSLQLLFSRECVLTENDYRQAISQGAVGVVSFLEGAPGIGVAVRNCGVPLMIFGRSTEDAGVDYVTTDDVQGGALAASRLLEAKCTVFQYVVEGWGMSFAVERYNGFAEKLAQYGWTAEVVDVSELGEEVYKKLHIADARCGIFCSSDSLAFAVMKHMGEIPQENRARLIGYDNLSRDVSLPISLTSIGLDKQRHAEFAIQKLIERIEYAAPPVAERQQVYLFEGETA